MREINELTNSLLYWVDHHPNEEIIRKSSTPMTSTLEADLIEGDYHYYFYAFSAAQGNGSCAVKVTKGKKVLLEATGNYIAYACNMKASTHKAGAWEKKIPKWR